MNAQTVPIPSHVPADLVIDFDFSHPPGAEEDVQLAWSHLREGPEIFWTPHNGGHWVVTRADDVEELQRNYDLFSYAGMTIPKAELPFRMLPLSLDPPEHTKFRALVQPFFVPRIIEGLEADARALCRSLIEGFYPRGGCEFMSDFAYHLPIELFLRMVDLPLTDRTELLCYSEAASRGATKEIREGAALDIIAYLERYIVARRENPGSDLISKVVQAKIDGEPLSEADIRGTLFILLGGGLDTVASMLGFFAKFLAQSPPHRRQIVDDPSLIPRAVEELLRRFALVANGREVTRDMDYKGVFFKKGDLICVPNLMYGLDESKFDDPLTVNFKRPTVLHKSFGSGVHTCPGSNLARMELKVFLQEWFRRIPNFTIAPGRRPVTRSGSMFTVVDLPLVWDVS